MPSNTTSAAALYTPRLGSDPVAPASASDELPRGAATVRTVAGATASASRGLGRVISLLGTFVEIIAVALAFPLVILAIGIPIALLVRLAIWIVRALSGW